MDNLKNAVQGELKFSKNEKFNRHAKLALLVAIVFMAVFFCVKIMEGALTTQAVDTSIEKYTQEKLEVEKKLKTTLEEVKKTELSLEQVKKQAEDLRTSRAKLDALINNVINPEFKPEIEEKK